METPTAEEFLPKNSDGMYSRNEVETAMTEFARARVDKVVKEMLEDQKKLEDFETWKEWKNTDQYDNNIEHTYYRNTIMGNCI